MYRKPGASLLRDTRRELRWDEIYSEPELYKAAIRLYTKPLFSWRKALSSSGDLKTLYDFARRGLQNLDSIHRALLRRAFRFRPGIALHHNFNGKRRTLYIYPWEERIVDLLLYRLLNRELHEWFSPHSYAYRYKGFGLDPCQRKIARTLALAGQPLYLLRRDIRDYFASVDHDILLAQLRSLIQPGDYLYQLLEERIKFSYQDGEEIVTASRGIPFGTAIACFFANLYLTGLDRSLSEIDGLYCFRYADDLLAVSSRREGALAASRKIDAIVSELRRQRNPRHREDLLFSSSPTADDHFRWVSKVRHLGLEFRANGEVGLSRDKFRKICNLFRFAFRRRRASFRRTKDPEKRARLAINLAQGTINGGVRNVAIIDYYLKHVNDEKQLRLLDRWLAEEVLSLAFGNGHKKGHFRTLSFKRLREMGLPSLVHRRRLIRHGYIESPFFIWRNYQVLRGSKGAAAKLQAHRKRSVPAAFSPIPEAAVREIPREREGLPVDGRY